MNTYNTIGNSYNLTRQPDERILKIIIEELNCMINSQIADVGAGTGNYTYELAKHGYKINAVEPSQIMMNQAKQHINISWFQNIAEELPFANDSMDGIVSTLASHHFQSLGKAYNEFYRILKPESRFVIFTFDPRLMDEDNWLVKYFPLQIEKACKSVPTQNQLLNLFEQIFGSTIKIRNFVLPSNLKDRFFASGWKNPYLYLDENFRKGISAFALSSVKEVEPYINKLKIDLENNTWQREFHYIQQKDVFNGGYYFISGKKIESRSDNRFKRTRN